LPPPVPWNNGNLNNPTAIVMIALAVGLLMILLVKRKRD
jgi:LPXTG-motif cell wall-anchored protein